MDRHLALRIAASGVSLAVVGLSSLYSWGTGRFLPITILNVFGLASIWFGRRIEAALRPLRGEALDGGFEPYLGWAMLLTAAWLALRR